jgi:serine/threonine protein kinase
MFDPRLGQKIDIDSKQLSFVEHPSFRGHTYAQEGRAAVVYKVIDKNKRAFALKVYKRLYQSKDIDLRVQQLNKYASFPGLYACRQQVITAKTSPSLVKTFPELQYAVLMPWIEGDSWFDVLVGKPPFQKLISRTIAVNFANILCKLERHELAHCDLSSANVIVNLNTGSVELIDLDTMYSSTMPRPMDLPAGSDGYAHEIQRNRGYWGTQGDRFSGAILLAEMLTFHDDRIRYSSFTESYFDQHELQKSKTNRFPLAIQVLREQGDVPAAELFEKVWLSESLDECPRLCEWADALAHTDVAPVIKKRPILEAKCTIVGQGSVGKTSLLKQVIYSAFDANEVKTEGIL